LCNAQNSGFFLSPFQTIPLFSRTANVQLLCVHSNNAVYSATDDGNAVSEQVCVCRKLEVKNCTGCAVFNTPLLALFLKSHSQEKLLKKVRPVPFLASSIFACAKNPTAYTADSCIFSNTSFCEQFLRIANLKLYVCDVRRSKKLYFSELDVEASGAI